MKRWTPKSCPVSARLRHDFLLPLGPGRLSSIYCLFSGKSVRRPVKVLSVLWLVASAPAALLITMGYAFNSNKLNPLITVPLWIAAGLACIWLPVALRALFRRGPD
ncbi:MAG: hypothetical protein IPK34_11780 [Ramlibacter sp.]|nr:hypothetical protein [Ramlibacter sp.]